MNIVLRIRAAALVGLWLATATVPAALADSPESDNRQASKPIPAWKRFVTATKCGDRVMVAEMLRANPQLAYATTPENNTFEPDHGWTALHWAVENDDCPMAQLLLKHGAGSNVSVPTRDRPLHFVRSLKMARILIAAGAGANSEGAWRKGPLYHAATGEIARLLIAHGANVNERKAELSRESPLHSACFDNRINVTRVLIACGAEVGYQDNRGDSPLHRAASTGNSELIALLLAAGARVNQANEEKQTPLFQASASGSPGAVRALIEAGANVRDVDEEGNTPLMWAACAGYWRLPTPERLIVMKILIANGASPHERTKTGETALHRAAETGYLEAVRYLLSLGVDVNAKSNLEWTALHKAVELERTVSHGLPGDGTNEVALVKLLIDRGADVNAIAFEEGEDETVVGEKIIRTKVRAPITALELSRRTGFDWNPDGEGLNFFPLQCRSQAEFEKIVRQYKNRNATKQDIAEMLLQNGAKEEAGLEE